MRIGISLVASILICLGATCLNSCVLYQSQFSEAFYDGQVTTNDMAGHWIITKKSLSNLTSVGKFTIYTNRSDHIIWLKQDGTCVYRTFSSYFTDHENEKENFERFRIEGDPNCTVAHQQAVRSWYLWNPVGEDVIDGPFMDKASLGQETLRKNKYSQWRLKKIESRGGLDWPDHYALSFSSGNKRYRATLGYGRWMIGEMGGVLCLWQSIKPGTTRDAIVFERVSKEELREIVRRDYGLTEGSAAGQRDSIGEK